MRQQLHALMVEDSEADAMLIKRQLQDGGFEVQSERVETAASFVSALESKEWDIILCDYRMPTFDGMKALGIVQERGIEIPFIFVSGTMGEERAVEAMKAGAHDYVMKENLKRLIPAIERELREVKARKERLRAEQTLLLNEKRFRAIIDNSTDAVALVDTRGTVLYSSPSTERILGYALEERQGKNVFDVIHPDDKALVRHAFRKLLGSTEMREPVPFRFRHKDGSWHWGETTGTNMLADPAVNAIVATCRDITGRKQAEEALRESEERFSVLSEASFEGILITDKDRIIDVNEQMAEMFGYERSEMIDVDVENFVAPESLELVKQHLRSGNEEPYEHFALRKDGFAFPVEIRARSIPFKGRVVRVTAVRDITERRRTEEALRRYQLLSQNTRDIILFVRANDGQILDVNDAAVLAYGYDHKELMTKSIRDLRAPETLNDVTDQMHEAERKGTSFETIHRRRDGTAFPVEVSSRGMILGNERIIMSIIRDITERKRTEEALKKSEEKFSKAFITCPEAISIASMEDGRYIEINDAFLKKVGFPREEVIGRASTELDVWVDMGERQRFVEELSKNGSLRNFEVQYRMRNKEIRDFLISSDIIELEGRRCSLNFILDITDRKRAEEALKRSEAKFRELFHSAPVGYHELDAVGTITNINRTELEMLGFTFEEVVDRPVWEFIGDRARSRKRVLAKLAGMEPPNKNSERTYIRKDGTTFPVLVDERLLFNQRGEITGMRTVIQDITEQRRAEEQLRESSVFNQLLVQTMPFGMDIVDEEGNVLFMSDAMKRLAGFDAVGRRCWSMYKDDKRQCHDCPLRKEIEFDKPEILESTGVLGGKTFQISHIGMMYQGKKAMLEMFEDVTERKKAEGALRRSEEKYRSLFEESKDGVYISTPEGKMLDINPAGIEMLGYASKEEMLRLNVERDLYSDPKQRNRFRELMEGQGFIKNFEEVLKMKNGQTLTVLDTATVVRDPQGRSIFYRGMMRDVTKEKRLEGELTQIQKLESIGTLASGIAHDFNNILGIVLGYSSLIERIADDPEKLSQSIQSINDAVQRGASLVKQILTFARKTEVVFGPLDVNVMIKEIAKMLRETFPKTIEFSLRLGKDIPFVNADATQLHQVLLNICVNARDAMSSGGTLTLKTEIVQGLSLRNIFSDAADGDYANIGVTDTGVGMDEKTRSHIFDPFFTTKEKGKGTGLGLSVVYGVMKNHNGFIDVQSAPGKGSTFNLYFPIPLESVQKSNEQKQRPEEVRGGNETILVVEDEEAMLTMAKVVLEAKGYRVLTATDGTAALEMYRKYAGEIALVLTDIGLPKISGDQLFYELKKVNPAVRVILASGYLDPEIKSEIFKAGAREFVQKPYDPDDVLRRVRETIDRK